MGRTLKQNVVLRQGQLGGAKVFLRGEELPDEFLPFVGEHLFEEAAGYIPQEEEVTEPTPEVKPKNKTSKKAKEDEPKVDTPPSRKASHATWASYAKEHGVEVPEEAGRNDIVQLFYEKFPELA